LENNQFVAVRKYGVCIAKARRMTLVSAEKEETMKTLGRMHLTATEESTDLDRIQEV
jgi:hypothetical protein